MIGPRLRKSTAHVGLLAIVASCCAALMSGCEAPPIEYREVHRIDEPLSEADVATFLRIVDSLPDRSLPALPVVYAPPPSWNAARTLPVNELVREEEQSLAEHWGVERLSRELVRRKALVRALARERMTSDQLSGLILAFGAALSRGALRDTQDLQKIVQAAGAEVEKLREDQRSFSSLGDDLRHSILLRALWITRRDRAERLLRVPERNVDLAKAHRERLSAALPSEFIGNPFDGIADLLEEQGIPFEELSESGTDDHIEWRRADALIGSDPL